MWKTTVYCKNNLGDGCVRVLSVLNEGEVGGMREEGDLLDIRTLVQ